VAKFTVDLINSSGAVGTQKYSIEADRYFRADSGNLVFVAKERRHDIAVATFAAGTWAVVFMDDRHVEDDQ
jgi:hypothetical protein